jgi:hypothetical protein
LSLSIQPASTITVSRSSAFSNVLQLLFPISRHTVGWLLVRRNLLEAGQSSLRALCVFLLPDVVRKPKKSAILGEHSEYVPHASRRRLGRFYSMQFCIYRSS